MHKNISIPNLDSYELQRIWIDDYDLIKQYYLWQNEEDEKDKYCFYPVMNGKTESTEEGLISFREHFKEFVKSTYYFILELKDTHEYLGYINLTNYNPRNQSADIGYYLPKQNRYKGYGSIMISLLLKIVFKDDFFWTMNKITAETAAYNQPSIRILEKHGFHLDGKIREHYWLDNAKHDQFIYTILRKEYLQHLEIK